MLRKKTILKGNIKITHTHTHTHTHIYIYTYIYICIENKHKNNGTSFLIHPRKVEKQYH